MLRKEIHIQENRFFLSVWYLYSEYVMHDVAFSSNIFSGIQIDTMCPYVYLRGFSLSLILAKCFRREMISFILPVILLETFFSRLVIYHAYRRQDLVIV